MKKSSNAYAVIGLGFGDEGKGLTVNSLCQHLNDPLVIRYSGGQQAGHTVTLKDGTSHVFSNFGSGSFAGASTYWSNHCTFDPVGFVREFNILAAKQPSLPIIYIDKKCPVTTPYDKFFNQNSSAIKEHGTCGAGVGATFQREESFYSLLVEDLFYPSVLSFKLDAIKKYYKSTAKIDAAVEEFLECCDFITHKSFSTFVFVDSMPKFFNSYVFESSQGLLLDQNFGFFPNVTRSSVGTKTILEMGFEPDLLLVTRAFQTRHGNGPMTNAWRPHNIKENLKETNILNTYQGEFKRTLLDLDLLKYGMEKDPYIKKSKNKELVITCLDLVKDEYRYTVGDKIIAHSDENSFVGGIATHLGIQKVHTVSAPDAVFDPFGWQRASYG